MKSALVNVIEAGAADDSMVEAWRHLTHHVDFIGIQDQHPLPLHELELTVGCRRR